MGDYMVIIDAYRGGEDTGFIDNNIIEKNYNLRICRYINDRLNDLGINTVMTRNSDIKLSNEDRINTINKYNNPNSILISNRLNYGDDSGVEIVYSLKNSDSLASKIKDSFEERDIYVNKIYQKRDENETNLDSDDLLKDIKNIQPIIISYGYINDNNDSYNLNNNLEKYGESVVRAIADYYDVPYSFNFENEYIVKKGDTLYSIAKKYNTTVENLKKNNNLVSNIINIGDILVISKDNNENIYVVQKGDSLWSISRKYNITVDDIKRANNLTSNLLSIGQKLIIPTKEIDNIYVVQKGDSLWSISRKYNITVDDIKRANNLTSNLLSIGQKLIIPF